MCIINGREARKGSTPKSIHQAIVTQKRSAFAHRLVFVFCRQVVEQMVENSVHHVWVVDKDDRPISIITPADILSMLVDPAINLYTSSTDVTAAPAGNVEANL